MPYTKALVVSGPEAIDGKLVFRVMVDGLMVTLSSYKALTVDSASTSLQMAGQACSPDLYAMARRAVMDYVAEGHTDQLDRSFMEAKRQPIRISANARNAGLACPRCDQSIPGQYAGTLLVCSGCESSIVLESR